MNMGRSFTTQQVASSTGALVTGLTEKLNQKRIDVSMLDAEVKEEQWEI